MMDKRGLTIFFLLFSLCLISIPPIRSAGELANVPEIGKVCPVDIRDCCDPNYAPDKGKCCTVPRKEDFYSTDSRCKEDNTVPEVSNNDHNETNLIEEVNGSESNSEPELDEALDEGDFISNLSVHSNSYDEDIVNNALDEYENVWVKGTKKESDPEVANVITDYFKSGKCYDLKHPELTTPTGTAWSAAFISYVMERSGVQFPASCAHINYFGKIKENPGECKTYPMDKIGEIKKGDILCQCRDKDCSISYSHLPKQAATHCDIITSRNGDSLEGIGGNVADSVRKSSFNIPQLGKQYFGFISCAKGNEEKKSNSRSILPIVLVSIAIAAAILVPIINKFFK